MIQKIGGQASSACGRALITDAAQESAQGNGSAVADGILHSVAVVVTQSNVTFYMDGDEQSSAPLERPVTDCSGKALEIGDSNILQLGEITFFARALTEVEMREIMFAGFTLQVSPHSKRERVFSDSFSLGALALIYSLVHQQLHWWSSSTP